MQLESSFSLPVAFEYEEAANLNLHYILLKSLVLITIMAFGVFYFSYLILLL